MDLHITTYGAYLHVRDEMFEIRIKADGAVEKKQFAAQKIRSILLNPGTALSSDAVKLALIHNIDILFVEGDGVPLGRVWHSKLGSTTRIRKRQLEASLTAEAVVYVKEWVALKMQRQIEFLQDLKKHRSGKAEFIDATVQKMATSATAIEGLTGQTIHDIDESLRGFEGNAGKNYFGTLAELVPEPYRFKGRSSRPAKDTFNAFLNYGYGILYGKVERSVMIAGLDPYVGFLHRDDYNLTSFVFDFIEPYRPWVDKAIFQLFSAKKVNKDHFEHIADGVRLNKEGKQTAVAAFHRMFDEETMRYNRRNTTRGNAIQLDAHAFAQRLIGTAENNELVGGLGE